MRTPPSPPPSAVTAKPLPPITEVARPFWDGCAAGELRVQRCTRCGARQLPPRGRCVRCGANALEWVTEAALGTVHSFTVVHRAPSPAFRGDAPYVVALVDIVDRARLMMNVTGCDPQAVHIGMRVQIGFVERRGDDGATAWLPEARPAPASAGRTGTR